MLYFAYGSNMCTGRLKQRVPSATFVRISMLKGHAFRFHKRSTDSSAKADAFETGNTSDVVWGVIFEIDDREKPRLDDAEGLGAGYDEKITTVVDERGQEHRVLLYISDADHIENSLSPFSWYKRFVVDGARQHALPAEYLAVIAAMPHVQDPDQARYRRNRSIAC